MYTVFAGTISVGALFTGVIVNAVPVQMVCVLFAITGVGFTVTTTLFVFEQPLAVIV